MPATPTTAPILRRGNRHRKTRFTDPHEDSNSEASALPPNSDNDDYPASSGDESDKSHSNSGDSNQDLDTDPPPVLIKKRKKRTKVISTTVLPHTDLPHPNPPATTVDVHGLRLPKDPPIKPTLDNYKDLAETWSEPELQHYLLCTKKVGNNRIPPSILNEARALEEELNTRLQVLSIAGGVSYDTLKYGVHRYIRENQIKPYNRFRKFSKAATLDNLMPPIDDLPGLASYNAKVCATWQEIKASSDQEVFQNPLFRRIALVISNDPADIQPHEHLSAEEEVFRPTFERLINLQKVKDELALSRNINQIAKFQEKGISQMEDIHTTLQLAYKTYGVHFHLLAASWNPTTTNPYAGWSKEFSSDPIYLSTFSFSNHILERFDRFVTGRNSTRASKTGPVAPNDQLRKDFTLSLNQLVLDHLKQVDPKKLMPRVHIHPKKKNCDVRLKSIDFPAGIRLEVHRTADSQVTPEMLAAGPASIMNDKSKMQTWYHDILAQRYTVVVSTPEK